MKKFYGRVSHSNGSVINCYFKADSIEDFKVKEKKFLREHGVKKAMSFNDPFLFSYQTLIKDGIFTWTELHINSVRDNKAIEFIKAIIKR
ncbi:hypothetical protein FACS1894110_24670 [Spirochaetia bacterium]|nr:hypothetical protein FACS1894110_24670 [Spirochaetia bacterium]